MAFGARALVNQLKSSQADHIVVDLTSPVDEPDRAFGRLVDWLEDHPTKKVSILYGYETPFHLIRIEP